MIDAWMFMYTACKKTCIYTKGERERGEPIMNSAALTSSAHPTETAVLLSLLFSMLSCSWPGCPLIAVSCLYRAETGSFSIMCQWLYSASYDLCTSTQYTHTVKCTNIWSKWHTLSPSPGLLKRLQKQWTGVASDTISCVPGQPQDRPSKYGGGLGPVWTTMHDGWRIDIVDDGWLLDDGWMMQIWMMGNEPPFMRLLSGYCRI